MAEQLYERPPNNQFPSKYEQLPGIGGESPRPNPENQVVPLRIRKSSPGNFAGRGLNMESEADERLRQLEMRLGVSEKSNRALLEEVLRLQNDLRVTSKRSEDILREERDSRQQLSDAIRVSNDLITQLSSRIKETEDKIEEEKASLNALFSHTKNVEKTVVQSQQDMIQKRDVQTQRLQELRLDLNETKSSRNQLEQIAFTLTEELRTVKSKLEGQQAEYNNVIQEIRNKTRKLEEENRVHMEAMRKQSDLHSMTDVTTTHLRGQVETRLSELRDVLMDLRSKHETEQTERRNLEKSMQSKINELQSSLSEQTRKREENMHTVDMVLREKDHAAQAERLQINAKVTDTMEDVNKKLLTKEMKIREDIQAKYLQLEKMVQREQQSRQDYEKSAREDTDRRWIALKKVLEDELRTLKDSIGIERGKTKETLGKLDQSITIVEKQLSENKKQVDKVMAAEIKSRKTHEVGTQDKINNVNEKLQIATSSLQQAIGGVSQNLQANNEKMKRELRAMMNDQQQGSTRALSDLDARLTAMKQRMANLEDTLDAKVVQSAHNLSERMHDRLEAIAKWQDSTGDTLRELGRSVQTIPQDVYQLEEKFKLMKSEMDSRVSHESDARTREIEILRQELQNLKSRMDRQPKPASLQDIEAMNVGVRKLADNLQTVKTVLGMKIQSEQKLRSEEVEGLQNQLDDIKKAIEPLVGRSHPLFVKDGDKDKGDNSPEVNNWGVYNAYKWLKWKSKLMYKLWEIRSRTGQKSDAHPYKEGQQSNLLNTKSSIPKSSRNKQNMSSLSRENSRTIKSPTDNSQTVQPENSKITSGNVKPETKYTTTSTSLDNVHEGGNEVAW